MLTHDTKLITRHKHESSCTSRFRCFNLFQARNNAHTYRKHTYTEIHIIFIIVWPFIVVLCRLYTNKSRTISEYRIKTAYFACQITYRNTHKPVSLFYFIYYYYHRHHYHSHMQSLHINVFCCHHKALALMNQQRSKNDHSKTSAYT